VAITKEQAAELLRAYIKTQTDATEAAIAQKQRETDEDLRETEAEIAQKRAVAETDERQAYSKAAVQALIDRHAVAQTLASLGMLRSGAADAATEAVNTRKTVAEQRAATQKRAVLSELSRRLQTARAQASVKKESVAADARKTLSGKIAEKTVSLNRAAV
jgi:hypothetical protein